MDLRHQSPHTWIDVAPLWGITYDSSYVDLFAMFSLDFGTGAAVGVEALAAYGDRH